jgi:putative oxidoreductase
MIKFSNCSEEAYAALRIVSGLLFSFHGAQKLLGVLMDPTMMPPVGSQMWFGGVIELVGGVFIMLGLFTCYAGLLASGEMAVAYFQFHWKFAFDNNFFPVVNHGEMAVIYCFLFLYIATKGAGKWSVMGLMKNTKKKR